MAAAALPTALRSITATKIVEVKKQRREFEDSKAEIEQAAKRQSNLHDEASALLQGAAKVAGVRLVDRNAPPAPQPSGQQDTKIQNYSRLLHQSLIDPAFPKSQVDVIKQDIVKDLKMQSVQRAHAQFFSELVTEWITSSAEENATKSNADSSGFETVGRKEMHEQRSQWESIVFSQKKVDETEIETYLSNVFTSEDTINDALCKLRETTKDFSSDLAREELFDTTILKTQIKGVLATDLLNHDKQAILKTFSSNDDVLQEVRDVLNMRFKHLATWEWTTENGAINVEQRRQLNGKYRVFMDEDVLDSILLHYLGTQWAVHFRTAFKTFFNSKAWRQQQEKMSTVDRDRREWFLGHEPSIQSVQKIRRESYEKDYFMTQLPETTTTSPRDAYDDGDSAGDDTSTQKNPLEVKHGLLHLLVAEAMVARHLYPDQEHAVIRSDFKWFGPSLPHQSIFSVMKFFGVSELWVDFFRKFLHAPLRFIQDGPEGAVQTRSAGVPMSHSLSDIMSEVVLFVMDFAVNKSTQGNIYRLHDDFWYFGRLNTCAKAWQQMKIFSKTMGIEFNEEKTGSVVFQPRGDSDSSAETGDDHESDDSTGSTDTSAENASIATSSLPAGDVRWGFLKLDAGSGRFKIDQAEVDKHIKEAKLQLGATSSIFGYIQAYNAYVVRFFSNNFGKPSLGFGREHVDDMIATHKRIHEAVFPNGRVVDHLSALAEKRFNVSASSIQDGFWYLPVVNGGMELRNPVVPLANMRESFTASPESILTGSASRDETDYRQEKLLYEGCTNGYGRTPPGTLYALKTKLNMSGDEPFMSLDEFLKYREQTSINLAQAYERLLSVPEEVSIENTKELRAVLETVANSSGRNQRGTIQGISPPFNGMDPYWKWIVAVYGKDIVDKYGSLQMVERAQVPLGIVSVMKSSKVRWQG